MIFFIVRILLAITENNYVYEINHYDVNRAYYDTFYFKSNEKYEIGDTIVFNLK